MRIESSKVVGSELGKYAQSPSLDVDLRPATAAERSRALGEIRAATETTPHVRVGRHRLKVWAEGWAENLADFERHGTPDSLLPRYFGKYPEVRLGNDLYLDETGRSEVALLRALQSAVIRRARASVEFDRLAEFGAGTGHNLLHLSGDPTLSALTGYEWSWSGVACINTIGRRLEQRISGRFFDYFEPHLQSVEGLRGACVLTVASLEQIGGDFRPFLRFLRAAAPAAICHIEPIQELMGNHELGELSVAYSRQRNYLDGFFDYVHNLAKAGEAEILEVQESVIGSKFINGYGVLIWKWR